MNADLFGATLTGGHFSRADFKGAQLRGATISGADLSEARNLTREQLTETCGDHATRLPPGVVLERVRVQEDPTLFADCTGVA